MLDFGQIPRFMLFTGKGGVGKTSAACAFAVALADSGRKTLLVSTDPASNLDHLFGTEFGSQPKDVPGVKNLQAVNIDPIQAAADFREKTVRPYRGILPDEAIEQIEEQLSGACTVEMAGFGEFSRFLAETADEMGVDHVILDTAPTGHTLRLLQLPAAWNQFLSENTTGSSCLGPVSALKEQQALYEKVQERLADSEWTKLVLVARAEKHTLQEAARAADDLKKLGLKNQQLLLNGLFGPASDDAIAKALAEREALTLTEIPKILAEMPRWTTIFRPGGINAVDDLRLFLTNEAGPSASEINAQKLSVSEAKSDWQAQLDELAKSGKGLIMTMGKGGVGKTTMAVQMAVALANRGCAVTLSTTDPAAHLDWHELKENPLLEITRIDPKAETAHYVESVISAQKDKLGPDELALLEEELATPCIEEIAVFKAFAKTVASAKDRIVVLDTAPTGHTLLLLDASENFQREAKRTGSMDESLTDLLPRLRDPNFTRLFIVTLAESTPVLEASELQDDLRRAAIEPKGWIVNRLFSLTDTQDPKLLAKTAAEAKWLAAVNQQSAQQPLLVPWAIDQQFFENL